MAKNKKYRTAVVLRTRKYINLFRSASILVYFQMLSGAWPFPYHLDHFEETSEESGGGLCNVGACYVLLWIFFLFSYIGVLVYLAARSGFDQFILNLPEMSLCLYLVFCLYNLIHKRHLLRRFYGRLDAFIGADGSVGHSRVIRRLSRRIFVALTLCLLCMYSSVTYTVYGSVATGEVLPYYNTSYLEPWSAQLLEVIIFVSMYLEYLPFYSTTLWYIFICLALRYSLKIWNKELKRACRLPSSTDNGSSRLQQCMEHGDSNSNTTNKQPPALNSVTTVVSIEDLSCNSLPAGVGPGMPRQPYGEDALESHRPVDLRTEMVRLRSRCKEVWALVGSLDELMSTVLLMYIITQIATAMFFIYLLTSMSLASDPSIMTWGAFNLVITIVFFLTSMFIIAEVHDAAHAGRRYLQNIDGMDLDPDTRFQITLLLDKLSGPPVGLSVGKFFILERSIIPTIVGAFATYLIVLMQIKPPSSEDAPDDVTMYEQGGMHGHLTPTFNTST